MRSAGATRRLTIAFAPVEVEPEAEGVALLLGRLTRAANQALAQALDDLGLRGQQFAILHRLADGGPATQAELAATLRVHAPNLVRVIDELEERELLARSRDSEDRRRLLIGITATGARLLGRAEQAVANAERELLAPLNAAERSQLRSLLGRLAAHSCSRRATGCR